MICPKCMCPNSTVVDSRTKEANEVLGGFRTNDIPSNIAPMDYRLRRHRCKKCFNVFYTIETYYRTDDLLDYMLNEHKRKGE